MSESGPKKFLFDREFEADATVKAKPAETEEDIFAGAEEAMAKAEAAEIEEELAVEEPVEPTYSAEELAQAREEGKREGRDEATRDLTGALESRVAETLDAINTQVINLFSAYAQDKEEHSRDAVSVATVIVRKMFPALNMDKAMAEIEHMIVEAMKRTSGSPRLIIRVTPDMQEQVEAKTQELSALRGYQGTIKVLADDALGEGTAHVEWDGGGMIRDPATMWAEVDDIIERNLGERAGEHAQQAEKAAQNAAPVSEQSPKESLEDNLGENPDENLATDTRAQEVVNSAPVGDNEESVMESPPEAAPEAEMAPETAKQTVHEDQASGGEVDDEVATEIDTGENSEQDG